MKIKAPSGRIFKLYPSSYLSEEARILTRLGWEVVT